MKLQLNYKLSETKDGLYAYALHIEVVQPEDSNDSNDSNDAWDNNIFVFRRSTPTMNPYGPTDCVVDDEFFNVATPVDMYDIPAKFPDIEHGMPYYRDSKVELWFRNCEDASRAKREISEDVASLVKMWDNINNVPDFRCSETRTYE